MKKILTIGASSSSKSINRIFANFAAESLGIECEIKELVLTDFEMPIYSEDKQNNSGIPKKAIDFKIDLINDVSGLEYDTNTVNVLKKTKIPFIINHSKGTPKNMQKNPKYKNVLLDIYDFFEVFRFL